MRIFQQWRHCYNELCGLGFVVFEVYGHCSSVFKINLGWKIFILLPVEHLVCISLFISHKAKGRISKRMFQESKACQNFRKTNISYLLIRTSTCVYQGVRNVCFSEILACFAFLKHPFWDSPFCLITDVFIMIQNFSKTEAFQNSAWNISDETFCENCQRISALHN